MVRKEVVQGCPLLSFMGIHGDSGSVLSASLSVFIAKPTAFTVYSCVLSTKPDAFQVLVFRRKQRLVAVSPSSRKQHDLFIYIQRNKS